MIARASDRFIPRLLVDAPDFRRLWIGQTISVLGDQVTQLGLPLVAVLTLGADAGQMGTLTAIGVLPHLLFSLPAGVWLDRVRSRRRLMVIADIGRAAIIASIPIAFAMDSLSMLQLYVVGFLAGSLSVVFDLSWNTVFVSVTRRERYVEAMSLLNGSRSLAYVAGPTIGGLLVQVLGAPLAMLADALSFLGSVVFLRRIRAPEPPIEAGVRVDPLAPRLRDRLRPPGPDHPALDARGRDGQPVHVRVRGAVHPVRDRTRWASRRGRSGWRWGSAPSAG